jgi:hypothetical protein
MAVWSDDELIALDEALKSLADFDRRKCQIVEMRYFSDMTHENDSLPRR